MPRTAQQNFWRHLAALFLLVGLLFPAVTKASVIRDTELEAGLLRIARPMAKEAGLNPGKLQIRIVISPQYNAFVMADGIVYVHSGLIMKADNISRWQGSWPMKSAISPPVTCISARASSGKPAWPASWGLSQRWH